MKPGPSASLGGDQNSAAGGPFTFWELHDLGPGVILTMRRNTGDLGVCIARLNIHARNPLANPTGHFI